MKQIMKRFVLTTVVCSMLAALISPISIHSASSTTLNIATFNIAAGRKPNLEAMNTLLSEKQMDVVGVQEVDYMNGRNNFDMLKKFSEYGDFPNYYFQKSIDYNGGEYGIGMLSNHVFKEKTGGPLTSEGIDEARAWQRVLIEKDGKEIAVYNTHLTHEKMDVRANQLREVLAKMDADPVEYKILTGDFNTDQYHNEVYPFLENYNIANGKNGVWYDTYNLEDPTMKINCVDNIITSRNIKVTDIQMVDTHDLSDHNLFYINCELLDAAIPSRELLDIIMEDARNYKESDYTTESYAVLKRAMDTADGLAEDADQSVINQSCAALQAAIAQLNAELDVAQIVNDSVMGTDYNEFDFVGKWQVSSGYPDLFYDGDEHWFNFARYAEGDVVPYYTIKFLGTGIGLYGNKDSMMGIYDVYLDGELVSQVDAYAPTRETQAELYEVRDLAYGEHTIKVQLTRNKNTASSASDGEVDFAKIYGVKEEEIPSGPLEIYPVPQRIDYKNSETTTISDDVNLVLHGTVKDNVMNELKDTLASENIEYTISDKPVTGKTNIVIISDPTHCADCIQYLQDEQITFDLTQKQASLLDISKQQNDNTNITLIGTDQDGLYYGVINLKQIFAQRNELDEIYEVCIKDYPNLEYRGFIEGFFGPPWTHAGRIELLNFSKDMKMNRYIYGPKDDPYHRTKWRVPYPEKEGKQISELAECAEKNNVEFTWAVHTTLGGDTIDFDSEKDYQDLLAKFESMYELGVRSYSMFFDDIADAKLKDPVKQATLANRINRDFIHQKDDVKPLSVVPYEYAGIVPSYLTPFGNTLDEDITVLWTGTSVCPDTITEKDLNDMQKALGREVLIWWNYPVNDYWYDTPGRLFLGPVLGLDKNINNTYGILSNPMSWESASQIALFSLADFTWNPTAYDADKSWKGSIKKLVPDQEEAMELFAKNSSHLGTTANMKIRRNDSPYLNEMFKEFDDKVKNKESIKEIAATLKAEFMKMKEAAATLRTIDNTALLEEINQWLDQFDYVGTAGYETMKMYEAVEDNNITEAKACKKRIDEAFQLMSENKRITQIGAMPELNILVATQYVVPFIQRTYSAIGDFIYFENENITDMKIEVNVETYDGPNDNQPLDWVAEKAIDKSMSSKLWTAVDQAAGQEVKMTFDKDENLHVISIYMEGNDTVKNGMLQYSVDGENWIDLKDMTDTDKVGNYTVLQADGKGVTARYVRILITDSAKSWLNINEIIFTNPLKEDTTFAKTLLLNAINKANAAEETGQLTYLAPSVKKLILDARDAAVKVYDDENATIAQVMEAWMNLADAMHYMDFVANKKALQTLVDTNKDLDMNDYKEGVEAFNTALANAKAVLADDKALQARIDEAYKQLYDAVQGLVEKDKADKKYLEMIVTSIKEHVGDGSKYKQDENWNTFKEALSAAEKVLADDKATQEDVEKALSALTGAYEDIRLEPTEDQLDELNSFVDKAGSINRSLYTNAQLKQIDMLVAEVKNMLKDFDSEKYGSLLKDMEDTAKLIDKVENKTPNKPANPSKPSVDGGNGNVANTTKPSAKPDTSDTSNAAGLLFTLMISGCGLYIVKRKRYKA